MVDAYCDANDREPPTTTSEQFHLPPHPSIHNLATRLYLAPSASSMSSPVSTPVSVEMSFSRCHQVIDDQRNDREAEDGNENIRGVLRSQSWKTSHVEDDVSLSSTIAGCIRQSSIFQQQLHVEDRSSIMAIDVLSSSSHHHSTCESCCRDALQCLHHRRPYQWQQPHSQLLQQQQQQQQQWQRQKHNACCCTQSDHHSTYQDDDDNYENDGDHGDCSDPDEDIMVDE